ncbi:MAG: HAD family hydrolase [Thermoplasmata archaeon]
MSGSDLTHRPVLAVVFDLDGTLVDSLAFCVSAIAEAGRRTTGRPVSEAEVRARFGPSESGVIRSLVGAADHAAAYGCFWEIYRTHHARRVSVFDGVPQLLRGLRQRGLPLALVTGKGEETARWTLEATGLGAQVGPVFVGGLEGGLKRENLGRAVARLGVAPPEAAYVADQPSDMIHAREAGLRPVGAGWAPGADRAGMALQGAEIILRAPRELLRWVDGQAERAAPNPTAPSGERETRQHPSDPVKVNSGGPPTSGEGHGASSAPDHHHLLRPRGHPGG